MTSWIRVPFKKKVEEPNVRPYFFRTESAEFCSQFNQYFYAQAFAASQGRPLIVYDQANPISVNFAMIKETFEDASGTTFTDTMIPNATTLVQGDRARVAPYINGLTREALRSRAATALEFKTEVLYEIGQVRLQNNVPEDIDVGLHIKPLNLRNGESIQAYVEAVREVERRLKKDTLSIFIVAEDEVLQRFLAAAPQHWSISAIHPSTPAINGFSYRTFERQPARQKTVAYMEFLASLQTLQTAANVITSLSTDVGKFIFLTNQTMQYFRSMDVAAFAA